ncbi:MAG: glycosyltransferase family 2 protein [Methylophilus sp.]|nr:glycosyltransferase family 2 protein [Methylophilus sp.]
MMIYFILLSMSILLLIPVLILFLQIVFAVISIKNKQPLAKVDSAPKPRVGIIVPAHNEASGLAHTLSFILPQLREQDQLVVVADNCSDNTAEVSRSAGAITLERFDQVLRGKGYALDFGMKYLRANPPDVVMIIDADCEIAGNLIEVLSKQCMAYQRPVQANYVMSFPTVKGIKQQITEFAWLVKNTVRPMGYGKLGLPCQLMGTGMAFKWEDLSKCNLASGHLVEDMKLGMDLAAMNRCPVFTYDTQVKSYFPTSEEGLASQRARWEHGHLGVIVGEVPKYLVEAIISRNMLMFAQALDLMVPPLALLLMLILGFSLISLLFLLMNAYVMPFVISLLTLSLLGLGILIAWMFFAREIVSLRNLLLAPVVLLKKIPLYIKFVVSRQVDWVRSKRDQD